MKRFLPVLLLLAGLTACRNGQSPLPGSDVIRVNQVGYYPQQQKIAVLEDSIAALSSISITDAKGETIWTGEAVGEGVSPWSGKRRLALDFSSVTTPGIYTLHAGPYSQQIIITDHALAELTRTAMKSYYLQRSGCTIDSVYAGIYARPAAHPDTAVIVHPSAASKGRPAGSVIASPKGWYDAGDFNKYIVNSSFTIGLLLNAYQQAPETFNALDLNIPESGNDTPDFLDELMYNLEWMLTMQDPADGGVYHKLTTPSFEAFIMPTEAHQPRYVVQKGTCASLDLAATMAQASRIYRAYPAYAEFADKALAAARAAYAWAGKNPDVMYRQNIMNDEYDPDITTGEYGDGNPSDEFFWAATEMFLATGDAAYRKDAIKYAPTHYSIPTWGQLAGLGTFEWINASDEEMKVLLSPALISYADAQLAKVSGSCFVSPFGNEPSDFHWASMPESCAGMGLSLMYAYVLTGDQKYLEGAQQNIDHMLGRNAVGYCFVTGFGTRRVMHPHQRISASDGIEAPLPGLLSGGPNPGQQDKATAPEYPSNYPDESYLDDTNSYASNEIAINWNAYLVALCGWMESVAQ